MPAGFFQGLSVCNMNLPLPVVLCLFFFQKREREIEWEAGDSEAESEGETEMCSITSLGSISPAAGNWGLHPVSSLTVACTTAWLLHLCILKFFLKWKGSCTQCSFWNTGVLSPLAVMVVCRTLSSQLGSFSTVTCQDPQGPQMPCFPQRPLLWCNTPRPVQMLLCTLPFCLAYHSMRSSGVQPSHLAY